MNLMHKSAKCILLACVFIFICGRLAEAQEKVPAKWVVFDAGNEKGLGKGKHIVLIAGDEEYRSEQAMPLLGKILSKHHGFKCTVLFSQGNDGIIDPFNQTNVPGLENLKTADLMMMFFRARRLPDEQMKHIDDYLMSGKPVIGLRTSTHAFFNKNGNYAHYTVGNDTWKGGFGPFILGAGWESHHGRHGAESTRGVIAPGAKEHPIVRGIQYGDIWGPTDVYGVKLPLPGDSKTIIEGQVLSSMKKDGRPVEGKKNNPMMPVAWTKSYQLEQGKKGQVFTTTMGAAVDLEAEGTRRLIVNAVYWILGLEVPQGGTVVDLVGDNKIDNFGFDIGKQFRKRGVRPADYEMK